MYESASKSMNQPRSQFFQHGCLYFEPARICHICMIITVNVFAYSVRFSKSISVLETVTVNCTVGETLILPWKTTADKTDFFFYFFGLAVRFDWIKIDIWLKLGVLHYSSRTKLSLGSAHVKYGVWLGLTVKFRALFEVVLQKQYLSVVCKFVTVCTPQKFSQIQQQSER